MYEDRIKALKMTEKASRLIERRTMERKLAHFGRIGKAAAWACQFNALERLFVRHRNLRRLLDQVVFTRKNRDHAAVQTRKQAETQVMPTPAGTSLI